MRLSRTLSLYIGRQFLFWFLVTLGGLLAIVLLLDTVELLRRAANKPAAGFDVVLGMGLLKLPEIGQEVVPFVVLFGGMYTFWRLTRSQELVVARASGISAWQFMAPVLAAAALIGLVQVGILNPIFSAMLTRYEHMENRYLRGQTSSLDVSRSGIWLRQVEEAGGYLIHAESVVPGTLELRRVMIIQFDGDRAAGRIDAASALLVEGAWELRQAWFNRSGLPAEFVERHLLPTELTEASIQESFASPETVSFWDLPRFIETLEDTGLSSARHRMHYQSLLAQPVLFCAMVLLAGAFSLRQVRRGGTLNLVGAGLVTVLVLFVVQDIVRALGQTGELPVPLAAWAPAGVALLLGATALLHLEDG